MSSEGGRKPPSPPYSLGYWADESVPDLSDILTEVGIDAFEFSAWLGPQLGIYRGSVEIQRAIPTRAEQMEALAKAAAAIQQAAAVLRPGSLPDHAEAVVANAAFKAKVHWTESRDRLHLDLVTIGVVLENARAAFSLSARRTGRKRSFARDRLLAEIVGKLRDKKLAGNSIDETAEMVLVRCKVPVPEDRRSLTRATRKGQKRP